MLVQGPSLQGERSTVLVECHHTPSGKLGIKAASIGVDVRHGGAATTVSSLDVGLSSGNINKTPSMPHDSPLLRVHTLRSDEGIMQQNKLMDLVTKLTDRVQALEIDLQQTKKVYSTTFTKLIMKVKRLEKIVKSAKTRRRAKIVVSDDEDAIEDTSKQGRKIDAIDQDPDISLVQHDAERITRVYENASSFNVEEWEDIQAIIKADEVLALRIQAEEREKYSEAKKARLLYSPKEIKYFSSNSGFLDDEKHETEKAEVSEAVTTLDTTPNVKPLPQKEKQNISYYVEPYEPPISFPRCLEQHAEEALVYENVESLKKIRVNHLGASISIMPFYMYKRLGLGKLEPINMIIETTDNTKCAPRGIVENLLVKIEKFIFPVDFVILDMVEDFRMPIILGRPLLATAHAQVDIFRKSISLEESYEEIVYRMTKGVKEIHLTPKGKRAHWCEAMLHVKENESMNDNERVDLEWEELSFNDWMRIKFGQNDMEVDDGEDPEKFGKDKPNVILEVLLDKLNEAWFNGTSEDEDDLEGILNYLEPKSYDGLIDLDDDIYKERKCKLLGLTYREPPLILIEKVKVTTYTIGLEETYTKVKVLGINEVPRTRDNIAKIKAGLMEKIGTNGGARGRRRAS
nr:hypothetical protein [Tanacetum cinerariifolium]